MPHLFPSSIIDFSAARYERRLGRVSMALYNALVVICFLVAVALCFIKVPVSVQSAGIIKSSAEKTPLFAPASGKIVFVKMKENLELNLAVNF